MVRFPNAKINLGLKVPGKRDDGFHEIETIMYPVGLNDAVEIVKSQDNPFNLTTSGLAMPGPVQSNLCAKAFALMQQEYDIPNIEIHLHKFIPMGAGLGGGSSDAAFVLRMINEMFELNLDYQTLQDLAAGLGSDCPFFIENKPAVARGRGELLETIQLSLSDFHLLVIKPPVHIQTREAYANIQTASHQGSILDIIKQPIDEWREVLDNDFESYAFKKHPELASIKSKLYEQGAKYASMSGSGSALYGLFSKDPSIDNFDNQYFMWKGKLL